MVKPQFGTLSLVFLKCTMGTILVSLSFMENAGNMASKFIFEIAYKEMHDLLARKF